MKNLINQWDYPTMTDLEKLSLYCKKLKDECSWHHENKYETADDKNNLKTDTVRLDSVLKYIELFLPGTLDRAIGKLHATENSYSGSIDLMTISY